MNRYKNTNNVFYLSLILDKDGYKRIDLVTSNKLDNIDNFIKNNFADHKDVRKKYDQEISEYCLDNMKYIKDENERNHRNWTGAITLMFPVEEYNYQEYRYETKYIKIPVLYKDGLELKPKKECIKIIKEKLQDRSKMEELFSKRGFLLSENEVRYYFNAESYIKGIVDGGNDKKAYDDLIYVFCKRLEKMPEHISYYYFRCLMDMFELGVKPTKTRVKVKSVKTEKFAKISKAELKKLNKEASEIHNEVEVMEMAPDEFISIFNDALETGDYDTLYNMYSIEEIDKYTNLLKGKRK